MEGVNYVNVMDFHKSKKGISTTKEFFVKTYRILNDTHKMSISISYYGLYNLYKDISKNDRPKMGLFAVIVF